MKLRDAHGKIPVELTDKMKPVEQGSEGKIALLEKEKALTLLEASLSDLSDEQKQCVTLFYLQKQSYNQITAVTGFTTLQVKSFIQNGKRNLKIFVEKKLKIRHA